MAREVAVSLSKKRGASPVSATDRAVRCPFVWTNAIARTRRTPRDPAVVCDFGWARVDSGSKGMVRLQLAEGSPRRHLRSLARKKRRLQQTLQRLGGVRQ